MKPIDIYAYNYYIDSLNKKKRKRLIRHRTLKQKDLIDNKVLTENPEDNPEVNL